MPVGSKFKFWIPAKLAYGEQAPPMIGPNQVRFAIRESYACGSEVANVGTITTTLGDGSQAVVEGVYTYRVDDEGRIVALRAYWEADAIIFVPAPG